MKPGIVINIRIKPSNCMAIYDALLVAGLSPADMTFSSGASRVLDMLLEALRRDKIIPTRDGFEYNAIMESFVQKTKAQLPSVSYRKPIAEQREVDLSSPQPIHSMAFSASASRTTEQRMAGLRWRELMHKKENAPDTWTAEDEQELEEVYRKMD